jgi:hypothetical protein
MFRDSSLVAKAQSFTYAYGASLCEVRLQSSQATHLKTQYSDI